MSDEEPQVTKRKVTLTSLQAGPNEGDVIKFEVEDYLRPDHLEAYVAKAKADGWQRVLVSEEPDAGPGGYHGATAVPADLDLPDAGVVYPADEPADEEG